MNQRLALVACFVVSVAAGCGYYGSRGHHSQGGDQSDSCDSIASPTVGAACDLSASSDFCTCAGLACMPVLSDGSTVCQVPGEFYDCDANVGCAAGLGCHYGLCTESCTTTADCFDPLTDCVPDENAGNQCMPNVCAGSNGEGLWQSCDISSVGARDGTCVPLDANAAGSGCQQGGSVAMGGACQLNRGGDGGLGFCAVGLLCMVDATGDNQGICLPACNAFGSGGPSCADGTSCVPTTLALEPAAVSALEYYSLTGACAASCTVSDAGSGDAGVADGGDVDGGEVDGGTLDSGDGGCPAPTSCMNGAFSGPPVYVCLP